MALADLLSLMSSEQLSNCDFKCTNYHLDIRLLVLLLIDGRVATCFLLAFDHFGDHANAYEILEVTYLSDVNSLL